MHMSVLVQRYEHKADKDLKVITVSYGFKRKKMNGEKLTNLKAPLWSSRLRGENPSSSTELSTASVDNRGAWIPV
jgi:hypothetical protein